MYLDRFIELNRSWLDKFKYTDYPLETKCPAWWNGDGSDWEAYGNSYFIPERDLKLTSYTHFEDKYRSCIKDWESYFVNWMTPTNLEMNYFELCEGYRLPWSEETPFIWEEE